MKKIVLFLLIVLSFQFVYAQKSGFCFYYGRNWSYFRPGLSNMSTMCHYYNYHLGTDINYKDRATGNSFGFYILNKYWQSDFVIIGRHNSYISDYIDPVTNEARTIGIKSRYNGFTWGNAFRFNIFAIGFGIELSNFNIMAKDASRDDFKKAEWNKDFLGDKISIMKIIPNPNAYLFYFDIMPKFVGVRFYYSYPLGNVEYAHQGSLSFYKFFPVNSGFCVYVNVPILED